MVSEGLAVFDDSFSSPQSSSTSLSFSILLEVLATMKAASQPLYRYQGQRARLNHWWPDESAFVQRYTAIPRSYPGWAYMHTIDRPQDNVQMR